MARKKFVLIEDHLKLISGLSIPITEDEHKEMESENGNIFNGGYKLIEEIALIIFGAEVEHNYDPFSENAFNLTEEQRVYCEKLLNELSTALKIVLQNRSFELGEYTSKSYLDEWVKVK